MAKRDNRAAASSSGLGERLLASGFRGLCVVMRSAAQCCGLNASDEVGAGVVRGSLLANGTRPLVDFGALSVCGSIPLGEIAAAERELRT